MFAASSMLEQDSEEASEYGADDRFGDREAIKGAGRPAGKKKAAV